MKTSDVDILIIPGLGASDSDHWQSRWIRTLKTARLVEQANWTEPTCEAWVGGIIDAVVASNRRVVLVAHSLGVAAVAHAAQRMPKDFLSGAYFVAPADVDNAKSWPRNGSAGFDPHASGFAPLPLTKLPFPSTMIASTTDPYCTLDRARALADAWHTTFVDAGDMGHINSASGHGPWPECVLRFGAFLRELAD